MKVILLSDLRHRGKRGETVEVKPGFARNYLLPQGLALVGPLLLAGTLSLVGIVEAQKEAGLWYIVPQIVAFFIYFVAGVAESNRNPFDLPEAESELVAGYHTEYSGMRFALFFLGEYANMIVISAVATTASSLGRGDQPSTRRAFSLVAFRQTSSSGTICLTSASKSADRRTSQLGSVRVGARRAAFPSRRRSMSQTSATVTKSPATHMKRSPLAAG